MTHRIGRVAGAVLAAVVAATALAGCTGSASSSAHRPAAGKAAAGSAAATGSTAAAVKPLTAPPRVAQADDLGIPVSGDFGKAPTVKVPSGSAPAQRTLQVLHQGTGAPVRLGQLLVANYQVTTWGGDGQKPLVLDDSFARHTPVALVVGARQSLADWDAALVGRTVGSRVLLLLPGRRSSSAVARPKAVLVDILATLPVDGTAAGTAVKQLPGLPQVVSGPDHRPQVTSVAGITDKPASQLVLAGRGAPIGPDRTLVVQMLRVDGGSGKTLTQTWGGVPLVQQAGALQSLVPALAEARVGSRAVAVLPATAAGAHPDVLVLDVVGQV